MVVGNNIFRQLALISINNLRDYVSFKKLSETIEVETTSPSFGKLKKFLLDNDFAVEKPTFGNAKLLFINNKQLNNFIKKTDQYLLVVEYIKKQNPFWYNI